MAAKEITYADENSVPGLDVHRGATSVVLDLARTDGHHLGLLGLLIRDSGPDLSDSR